MSTVACLAIRKKKNTKWKFRSWFTEFGRVGNIFCFQRFITFPEVIQILISCFHSNKKETQSTVIVKRMKIVETNRSLPLFLFKKKARKSWLCFPKNWMWKCSQQHQKIYDAAAHEKKTLHSLAPSPIKRRQHRKTNKRKHKKEKTYLQKRVLKALSSLIAETCSKWKLEGNWRNSRCIPCWDILLKLANRITPLDSTSFLAKMQQKWNQLLDGSRIQIDSARNIPYPSV